MIPYYRNQDKKLDVKESSFIHVPPHLHNVVECIFVTEGFFDLGIGEQGYHMGIGDFAMIFPGEVHYFQNFHSKYGKAIYIWVSLELCGRFYTKLRDYNPCDPIIKAQNLHPDIAYICNRLKEESLINKFDRDSMLPQAYMRIILERVFSVMELKEKEKKQSENIAYQVITYLSEHFRESISLKKVAHEMGISPYTLSRIFPMYYHKNFKAYLNELRLEYARILLLHSDEGITDIGFNAGFGSQRSFNRLFLEKYHRTPREYRREQQ